MTPKTQVQQPVHRTLRASLWGLLLSAVLVLVACADSAPKHPLRLQMYNVVISHAFEVGIIVVILLNMVQMAATWSEPAVNAPYMAQLIEDGVAKTANIVNTRAHRHPRPDPP